MFNSLWHTIFFDPIYNSLIFFIDALPGGDVGLAIVCTVVLVKLVLLPLSFKAARTQLAMRMIEPKLKEIREKYKDKREEMAQHMLALYKDAGVNPFSSILLLFIQIPVVIALYLAVYRGGGVPLPDVNVALLYSFIPSPETINLLFLGLLDITTRSIPLALLAGVTQYIHTNLTLPKHTPRDPNAGQNFKEDLARSMNLQMRYVMPVIVFMVAYSISAAIALYFAVSNLVAIGQEYLVRHKGLKTPTRN
ncbi:membrane protein insertase YidC [Candidatus Kaiserbacteria bacterium]|nr:membrane protein insertase YidC [Candidatus Kaiserbacteria bacterium]